VNIVKQVLTTVENTIKKYKMFDGVDCAVIAFSSGPDSVCLLDVLHRIYGGKINFHLVYINHGLRAPESLNKEERLTKRYAEKYNLDYKIIKIKVKKTGTGIEDAARRKRYDVLLDYMEATDCRRIVLGHNCDDLVETFLMNMIRGSGARGLRSIPAVRLPFVRPLIDLKKEEILEYLRKKRLSFTRDRTNRSIIYRRNFVRRRIIPEILKINSEFHKTIKKEIEILKEDDDYLEREAERVYRSAVVEETDHISLDIKKILRYNSAVTKRVVMRVIKRLHGDLNGFESKHFEEILGLKIRESGKKIDLPKGLYARREYDRITIGIARPADFTFIPLDVDKQGSIEAGDYLLKFRVVAKFSLNRRKSNVEVFDLDKLELPLFLRNRKRGDYIETKVGKKKFKKIYNEFKIPRHKRDRMLLLCDQKGVLMIPGFVRAYRAFIDKKTKRFLVVEVEYTG